MKRMLIDDTQPEETRVVIVDGNKVEDVEFESSLRKQIKGNIFTAKVVRIEPSLQAAFVDYGGNRHGFLAFGEIHPDYYNISDEIKAEVEKEVDEIIEKKRQYLAERKAEQERRRLEREQKRAEYEARRQAEAAAKEAAEKAAAEESAMAAAGTDGMAEEDAAETSADNAEINAAAEAAPEAAAETETGTETKAEVEVEIKAETEVETETEVVAETETAPAPSETDAPEAGARETGDTNAPAPETDSSPDNEEADKGDEQEASGITEETDSAVTDSEEENSDDSAEENSDGGKGTRRPRRTRFLGRRSGSRSTAKTSGKKSYKVSAETAGIPSGAAIAEDYDPTADDDDDDDDDNESMSAAMSASDEEFDTGSKEFDNDDDDDDAEHFLEIQRKLIFARKLYHRSAIQDVIREGQTVLIQIVKEERGNKGAACTTYLSLAGRYCVLMPNRIKSGGVSRKITSANDRKRLKDIIRELPLNDDMSLIIRTAGEDKQKSDIVRDYNYLIRTWNHIRHSALSTPAPALIYEEGNLIKRALRDMYTKDIGEVIIDGDTAYKTAKEFSKILAPNMGRKIKCRKPGDIPVFQQYQVEKELDKLHNPVVQLASGGYLVINPTEALVSIDVNSGRATREKDIEETALKTNLEAADEIAKQLRMRNLAGLIVVDFIDMEEAANNHAVEKRMKEAMKPDRARVQIAKMSIFGLLEISRQRMHSSFIESNYVTCPYCRGQGVLRSTGSGAMLVLRALEEEGIKGVNNHLEARVPQDTAVYLLNQKRRLLADLEEKYGLEIIISADSSIKNISDFKIDKSRVQKSKPEVVAPATAYPQASGADDFSDDDAEEISASETGESTAGTEEADYSRNRGRTRGNDRRRRGHRGGRGREPRSRGNDGYAGTAGEPAAVAQQQETPAETPKPEKKAWWKKLLG